MPVSSSRPLKVWGYVCTMDFAMLWLTCSFNRLSRPLSAINRLVTERAPLFCKRLRSRLRYLQFQGDEQIKLLVCLIIPELGGSYGGAMMDEGNMVLIALIRHNDTTSQRQHAHLLFWDEYRHTSLSASVVPRAVPCGKLLVVRSSRGSDWRSVSWNSSKDLLIALCLVSTALTAIKDDSSDLARFLPANSSPFPYVIIG